MKTAYDWVTVLIFAGLVTHFLQQSTDRGTRAAPLWQYALATGGCALADWLGNGGQTLAAIAVIGITLCFIAYMWFSRAGERHDH
jgi:hypothetical protein